MKIKIVNKSGFPNPKYSREGDSCVDICCSKEFVLEPGGSAVVSTGIYVKLPKGYELQVRGRSGLAYKDDIIAHFGTIDSNYTGEIKVKLFNLGKERIEFQPGIRIAQLALAKSIEIKWENVEELEKTNRGGEGFGSSGKF